MLSLAIRTASSSSSKGITTNTGPKMSSRAIVMALSTSVNSVGSTYHPLRLVSGATPTECQRRSLLNPALDVAEDARALLLGDERAHHHVGSLRVSVGDLTHVGREELDALVVTGAGQEHPGRDRTPLAGMGADGQSRHHGGGEVGVVEDDGGGLAPELQEQPLHRGGALLHDPLPHRRRAREGDEVDLPRRA